MGNSRAHDWTKGVTNRLIGSARYKVTYRARFKSKNEDWKVYSIEMRVPMMTLDPEGRGAVDRRIRFLRERWGSDLELEVPSIERLGDEVPLQSGALAPATVVSESEYTELEEKQKENRVEERKIILPGEE